MRICACLRENTSKVGYKNIKAFVVLPFLSLIDMMREKIDLFALEYGY